MGKQKNTKTDIQKPLFPDGGSPISCIHAVGEILSEAEAKTMRERIPLNPLATPEMIAELKGEDDPLDCIFAVDYRTSKSGVEYLDSAYEHIVETILTSTVFVPSCYGHQSQEAFLFEGRDLYGSVIGALLDKTAGKIYHRIIPDKGDHAEKIRRWLKNKQINAVSIWGVPTYADGSKRVVLDYALRSIDFVPPLSEGQHNESAIGQMAGMSFNEQERKIRDALREQYADYVFTEDFYDDYVIGEYKNQLYKIPYSIQNDTVIFGAAQKVRRVVEYKLQEVEMELTSIANDELTAEIARRAKNGLLSAQAVAGEMGVKLEDAQKMKDLEAASSELAELKQAAGEMALTDAITFAKKAKEEEKAEAAKKAFGEMVNAVKAEKGLTKDGKPTGEMAAMVDKFCHFETGMSKEQVAGEMDRVMNDADIQKLVQGKTATAPVGQMTGADAKSEPEVYEI
ncbi:hypothetical protein [Treponema sp. OMZ 857]|uniref:hypothetical protein n=1 Tax=Treponema sp. OMZ 857 TaxID=1643513 RepID=UPI0020A349A5|nr:hypothetical protein [Treponema sp. OMZ 857]UTC44856.1 hypothetical protein E4N66_12615 [Treponema sp. OMZ 857]